MSRAVYGRPSDNVASAATITISAGTEDSAYPKANLVNLTPAQPAKLTTTTGAWLFDFGSTRSLDLAAIINHNLSGCTVKIQANASDSWGAPTIDQAFTLPTARLDGFTVSPFVDLTGIGSRSFRYWQIAVTTANGSAVSIGEVVLLATKRTLEINPSWQQTSDADAHATIEHVTNAGVSILYDVGSIGRTFTGNVLTTDAGQASLAALWQDAHGRAKPWLWIENPAVNDAWFVRFVDPAQTRGFQFYGGHAMAINVQELSRGLSS